MAGLGLSDSQKARIAHVSRSWEDKKSSLLAAMAKTAPSQGRVDQIQAQLEGYSRLSRQFDVERRQKWDEAVSVLDSAQRRKVKP